MIINKRLFDPVLVDDTVQILYQVPEFTKAVIKSVNILNTSEKPVSITLYVVPKGGEAGIAEQVYIKTIAAKETKPVFELTRMTLEAGDTLRAVATISDSLTVHGSGAEIT